jgi:hypothetical protein
MGKRIKRQISKKKARNQGSAMVVAIVVGVVIMVFVLSLLLLSYSVFSSAAQKNTQLQCRELAKSVNQELRQELTTPDYDSYDAQAAAEGVENNLWFFLRSNLWQNEVWPYYQEGVAGHGEEDSYRYFTMHASDSEDYADAADTVLVTLYWEIDSDNPQEETDKSMTLLHVQVMAEKGDCSYTMETVYALTVTSYEGASENDMQIEDSSYGLPINTNEKWIWTPD